MIIIRSCFFPFQFEIKIFNTIPINFLFALNLYLDLFLHYPLFFQSIFWNFIIHLFQSPNNYFEKAESAEMLMVKLGWFSRENTKLQMCNFY